MTSKTLFSSLTKRASNAFANIVNILFPKFCISCRREGEHLCEDCMAFIAVNQSEDGRARPAYAPSDSRRATAGRPAHLSGLFYAASYEHWLVRNAIHLLKYQPFLKDLAPRLSLLIIAHLSFLDKPPAFFLEKEREDEKSGYLLLPIPLFPSRLRWRGFNQAEEIAKPLSRFLRIPLAVNALVKTKHTQAQAELAKDQRAGNVAGAFRVLRPDLVKNKRVILVDDVCTSGSTMSEAARVLKQAGAKKVYGIALARG